MIRVPLFLSYGMPKSGSTLAFELTRTMLELAGVPQEKIGGLTDPASPINFVDELDGTVLAGLLEEGSRRSGPVAVKTHSRLFPKVAKALEKGLVTGHAVCRDPRDIALSMLDAARDGRAWGETQQGKLQTVADTEVRLKKYVGQFQQWASMPGVMAIHYERLAFDTEKVAEEIAGQLGVEVDIRKAVEIATGSKFTQFNQGKPQRWKTEMDPADAKRLEGMFGNYIRTYCSEIPSAPKARKPATGLLAKWMAKIR